MKTRRLILLLLGMAVIAFFLSTGQARASIQPILAVDNVFTALNSGDVEAAMNWFAEDAVAENLLRKESYVGKDEIRQMLQAMPRAGRQYDIVWAQMAEDQITFTVEVSDRGFAWGLQTFTAEVKDGKVSSLKAVNFRLTLRG